MHIHGSREDINNDDRIGILHYKQAKLPKHLQHSVRMVDSKLGI